MTSTVTPGATADGAAGTAHTRIEGPAKVTGNAVYAYEQDAVAPLHLRGVGATVARGRVRAVDTTAAEAVPGVVAVLSHSASSAFTRVSSVPLRDQAGEGRAAPARLRPRTRFTA